MAAMSTLPTLPADTHFSEQEHIMGSIEEILERVKRLKIDNADAMAALKDHNDEQLDVVTAKIFSELESVKADVMKEVKAALQGTQKVSDMVLEVNLRLI